MPKQVEFFYDFTSPTAYLAWARLPAIAQRTGAKIIYRPMFLGGVMQTTGNRPPGTLPQKAEDLVPGFLDAIPGDPWQPGTPLRWEAGGGGIRYRIRSAGKDAVLGFPEQVPGEKLKS